MTRVTIPVITCDARGLRPFWLVRCHEIVAADQATACGWRRATNGDDICPACWASPHAVLDHVIDLLDSGLASP